MASHPLLLTTSTMRSNSPTRGSKHPRAASTVSRDAKRAREDDDAAVEHDASTSKDALRQGRTTRTRTRKRDNAEIEDDESDAETIVDDEHPAGADANEDLATGLADDTLLETSVVSRLSDRKASSKVKGSKKAARTQTSDSPSSHKQRVPRGKRDPFVTSPAGSKAKGKRVVDDSEDHEIGDEWTDLNGLRWKMGEDRELRREAIVVEMRRKYPNMPRDSRHPDAKLKVPVLVERFLTEKEYEDARAKKLLSFQEEEREREKLEKDKDRQEKLRQAEEMQHKQVIESGRDVMTPRRVRNTQALFDTSPRNRLASPRVGILPYTVSQRSRSLSVTSNSSGGRMSIDSPAQTPMSLSSSSLTTPGPSVQHNRLSLPSEVNSKSSMSNDPSSSPLQPLPMSLSDMPPPVSYSTPRHRPSYRLPLTSPASPGSTLRKASAPSIPERSFGESGSLGRHSPLSSLVAKRKREEGLVKILQDEAQRRKQPK